MKFLTSYDPPDEVKNAQPGTGNHDIKVALEELPKENYEAYTKSFKLLKSAIAKRANALYVAYAFSAAFHYDIDELEIAMEHANYAHVLKPTWISHLVTALIMSDVDEKIADSEFGLALKLNPKSAAIYYFRGKFRITLEDKRGDRYANEEEWEKSTSPYADGRKDLQKAMKLESMFDLPHVEFANSFVMRDDEIVAMAHMDESLSTVVSTAALFAGYAKVLKRNHEIDSAVDILDQAIMLNERETCPSPKYYVMKAMYLEERYRLDKQMEAMNNPDYSDVDMFDDDDDSKPMTQEQLDLIARAAEIDPHDQLSRHMLAEQALVAQNPVKALEYWEQLKLLEPDDRKLMNLIAKMEMVKRKADVQQLGLFPKKLHNLCEELGDLAG